MEFASLQDAFPQLENSKERKNPRKPKGNQSTDPDRPAMQRMTEIPYIGRDAESRNSYLDASVSFQEKPTVNNSLPAPRQESHPTPSFFGVEPFSNPEEDSAAIFNNNAKSFLLETDFTKSFDQPGFGKSGGVSLPTPELRQRWKPMSADRVDTAFTNSDKGGQFHGLSIDDIKSMHSKIDALVARLDDMEDRGGNPQLEMLSFIMTGLFLMFTLDLAVRKANPGYN